MKRTVRNYIIRILIMVVLSALIVFLARFFRPSFDESTEHKAGEKIEEAYDITLWYYDDAMDSYVKHLKDDYFRNSGLRVNCVKVSGVDFFGQINEANVNDEDAVDVYITESTKLEHAYLSGNARINDNTKTFSIANYSKKALSSVFYDRKMVGYPLCFDMGFFAYNNDYIKTKPESFKEIEDLATAFVKNPDSPVDMVILFDVADLIDNFLFVGNYMELGGLNNDDPNQFDVYNNSLIEAAYFYQELSSNFKINMNTNTYDLVENSFAFGRSQMAILNCRSLAVINKAKTNYTICTMPKLDGTLESKPLSTTWCVCVNPMSKKLDKAVDLAEFMSYENASEIYNSTGLMSCRRLPNQEKGFKDVYELYEQSVSLPKLIETEDIWEDMKTMLNNIWNGSDPSGELSRFQKKVFEMVKNRTSVNN